MKRKSNKNADAMNFVDRSILLRVFLAEKEEILKHKWLESGRLGYDIGFYRARLGWYRNHRQDWIASRWE